MSLNLDPTTQTQNQPMNIPVNTGITNFAYSLHEFHPHLQNLLKQQVEIYVPWVPQGIVRPLDDFTQMRCNYHHQ